MKTQRKTLFKVVCRETRKGSNFAIACEELRSRYIVSYIHIYTKGSIITAAKHTLGIFVFRTRRAAEEFIDLYDINEKAMILRVKPIGRGKVPKVIAYGGASVKAVIKFYLGHLKPAQLNPPPKGAICYPAIKVFD